MMSHVRSEPSQLPADQGEEDDTGPMRRATSLGDPHSSHSSGHDVAVYGYDPSAYDPSKFPHLSIDDSRHRDFSRMDSANTPRASTDGSAFRREFWRANEKSATDPDEISVASSVITDDEGETTGDESVVSDAPVDEDHARSTAAAGIELYDRSRRS